MPKKPSSRRRDFVRMMVFFLCGSIVLILFSFIQKSVAGFNPFQLNGYIVPFLFGGLAGAFIGLFSVRRKQAGDELQQHKARLEELVVERTADLRKANEKLKSEIREREKVEKAFQEREALLNHSQKIASMGNFIWDLRNDALFWSQNMYAIHGLDEASFEGNLNEVSNQLIHPEDRERVRAEIEKMVEAGRVWSMEFRIIRPDGEERIMCSSGEFELDELGRPVKCFGVHQDITESEQTKRHLAESEHRYRVLVENAQDAIYVLQEGLIRFANTSASKVSGYSWKEMAGRSFTDFLHEEDRERIRQRYEDRLAGQEVPTNYDLRIIPKDGRDVWMQINQVVIDWEGQPATLNIARDISTQRRMEEALLESEKKYRQLIELSPDLIAVHRGREFVFINESGLKLLGASDPSEVIGKPITNFVEPTRTGLAQKRIQSLMVDGDRSPIYEQKLIRLDGVERDIEVIGTPFFYEGQEAVQIIARDVTERKRIEDKLSNVRELLQKTSRMAKVGGWSADLVTGVHEWSEVTREIHEVGPEFVPDFENAINFYKEGKSREKIIEVVNHCIETGEPYDVEVQFISAKGTERWIRTMGNGEFRDGKCIKIHGTFQDITKLRQSEKERERLLSAIEQVGEIILITNTDGTIQFVNPAFEKTTGYTAEEVKGQNPRILKSGKQDTLFYRQLWETITAGDTWQGRMVNRRKDGSLYTENTTISPVLGEQGKITNFVAVKRDITSELELENRLAQSQKMESIGTLAGGIAHDFNNILSAIMGFTEIVDAELPDGSRNKEDLGEVLHACMRARDLVKQILTFSRQSDSEMRPLRIDLVVNEALKMIRSSTPTSIEIRQNIKPDVPTVIADPTQIHQIMMNLCTNAVHAMEDEHGTISVSLGSVGVDDFGDEKTERPKSGEYVRLVVSDTGKGLPQEIQERIFEPYFTTKKAGEGTGLGLSVVYGIVKESGGTITVQSEVGKGTTFSVFLPAAEKSDSEQATNQQPSLPWGQGHILFIDDEPSIANLGRKSLERFGYDVTIRQSSLEALELFRNDPQRFDLVVTDMTMPQMTGDELTKEILSIRPDIPIVLCTGYSNRISDEKAKEIGISAFVMKPLTQHELANTVRRVLDRA